MTNDATNSSSSKNPAELQSHISADMLSAYIDGGLRPNDVAATEAHLQACATCRDDLADLRATVNLLHALPDRRPTRSFQLAPESAGRPVSWLGKLFAGVPAVRVAAAAIAVLLVVLITGDLMTDHGPDRQMQMAVQAPSTMNATLPSNAQESDDIQAQRGAKPASTNPPPPVSAARQPEPTQVLESASAAQAASNAAFRAPAPAGAAPGGAADAGIAASPAAIHSATPPPTAIPRPTASVRDVTNSQSTGSRRPSWWRIVEIALAIMLLWLIVSAIGFRRIRP